MAAARPTWLSVRPRPLSGLVGREAIVPTMVTSSPSRTQTVPSPMTISQCQRATAAGPGARGSSSRWCPSRYRSPSTSRPLCLPCSVTTAGSGANNRSRRMGPMTDTGRTRVAIACQGGGSHTAFTAGVLKRLLGAEELAGYEVVGLSGTSGGGGVRPARLVGAAGGRPGRRRRAAGGVLGRQLGHHPAGAAGQRLGGVGGQAGEPGRAAGGQPV